MAAYRGLFTTAEDAVCMLTCYRFVPGQDRPDHVECSWFPCILLLVGRDESSAPIVELNIEVSTGVSLKQTSRDRLAQDYWLLVVWLLELHTSVPADLRLIARRVRALEAMRFILQSTSRLRKSRSTETPGRRLRSRRFVRPARQPRQKQGQMRRNARHL